MLGLNAALAASSPGYLQIEGILREIGHCSFLRAIGVLAGVDNPMDSLRSALGETSRIRADLEQALRQAEERLGAQLRGSQPMAAVPSV